MTTIKELGSEEIFAKARKSKIFEALSQKEKRDFKRLEQELLKMKMYKAQDVNKRTLTVRFKLSQTERDILEAKARSAKRTISDFIRVLILEK